jgi:hypothetical protein
VAKRKWAARFIRPRHILEMLRGADRLGVGVRPAAQQRRPLGPLEEHPAEVVHLLEDFDPGR